MFDKDSRLLCGIYRDLGKLLITHFQVVCDGLHLLNVLLFSTGNLRSTIYSEAPVKVGSLTMLRVEMLNYSTCRAVLCLCNC